jgi:hypothetical protein
MISVELDKSMNDEIGQFVQAFNGLQKNIRNKYLKSALNKTLRPGRAVLKRYTPPEGVKRGRRKKGEASKSTGALKAAVAVRTKATKDAVFGVLGYKAGAQSRKAIWLEFGTNKGIDPRRMVERAMQEFGPQAASTLAQNMAIAFENALKDRIPAGKGKFRG